MKFNKYVLPLVIVVVAISSAMVSCASQNQPIGELQSQPLWRISASSHEDSSAILWQRQVDCLVPDVTTVQGRIAVTESSVILGMSCPQDQRGFLILNLDDGNYKDHIRTLLPMYVFTGTDNDNLIIMIHENNKPLEIESVGISDLMIIDDVPFRAVVNAGSSHNHVFLQVRSNSFLGMFVYNVTTQKLEERVSGIALAAASKNYVAIYRAEHIDVFHDARMFNSDKLVASIELESQECTPYTDLSESELQLVITSIKRCQDSDSTTIYAINPKNGTINWQREYNSRITSCVYDNKLFILNNMTLSAFNIETGAIENGLVFTVSNASNESTVGAYFENFLFCNENGIIILDVKSKTILRIDSL